jgi:sigma-E factor negative regulatory protein RseA
MSQNDEKLSALIDGALDKQDIRDMFLDLKRNPVEDAERMQRYQLMGDAMRDDISEASFMDISAAVSRAIENEPALNQVPSSTKRRRRFDFSAWTRPITGMAIAASVASVTVISVRMANQEAPTASPTQVIAATTSQSSTSQSSTAPQNVASIVPVNPNIAQHVRAVSTEEQQLRQLRNNQLSKYMMNHSGSAGQTQMQGLIPYVRVVSFGSQAQQ